MRTRVDTYISRAILFNYIIVSTAKLRVVRLMTSMYQMVATTFDLYSWLEI